ncbi:lysophospholipid acyltransferase family protein [Raineyella fluvialis]|uniref:1-acyl-sn-glycerol-3-phosphate acyltransferase n=1 Tax=Raineyella fluvialis TaxID=2662261 RepID=A0A5Q2FFI4_9ACTN|nr:lysophospholipid acyltransferase family protein [Raineyella fluvialis]QGF24547.1 1-acyl-sn-glycerol-3-phosphate acyltransferase [Raineyella fluvialis]
MTVDTRIDTSATTTAPGSAIVADLPFTDHLDASRHGLLRGIAGPGRAIARALWDIRVHGAENVPSTGPVLLAANHIATMDGPLSVLMSPRRPTYALAKQELFRGALGDLLHRSGQIPIARDVTVDRSAIDRCIRVLRDGQALVIFPEGMRDTGEFAWIRSGVAYLAMVTGAPIVPVAMLGTRKAGDSPHSTPRLRSRMHVVYGTPIAMPAVPWPRRQHVVRTAAEHLRVVLAAHVRQAAELTGMPLPGVPRDRIARTGVPLH